MIDWSVAQNTIHAWVAAGSQLPAAQVIWAAQQAPRPPGQIVVLRLASVASVGQDWTRTESNPTPTPGAEVVRKVQGHRVATLSIQVFGGASPLGASANLAVLERIMSAVRLPSIHAALGAARVGFLSAGAPIVVDGARGDLLEARAAVEVQLCLISELSETGTNIAVVEVTSDVAAPETFTVAAP